jgi:hypothetical protein
MLTVGDSCSNGHSMEIGTMGISGGQTECKICAGKR